MYIDKLSKEATERLIQIDFNFYRNIHKDLLLFNDAQLLEHYANFGYQEGRVSSPYALRENFIVFDQELKCLEIGPFFNPLVKGKNVKYLDVLSESELIDRAKSLSASQEQINNIPYIDFVSKDGSLKLVNEKFDVLVSSHNLEHQADLIGHLNEASDVLVDRGVYKMIIPNCAYCFDANLPPSKISEIVHANRVKPKTHSIAKVIEHRALTVHNHPVVHWEESKANLKEYALIDESRVSSAINEFDNADGKYIDVHSWQFKPHTLSDILRVLIKLNLIRFSNVICYGPVINRLEFCIELIK
jgi:hypothetical protein